MEEQDQQIQGGEQVPVIHWGHFGTIALCALVLIFTAWMKSGFNFVLRPQSQPKVAMYTYDQAKEEVQAQNKAEGIDASAANPSDNSAQLAMLDPTMTEGSVLGDSTGTGSSLADIPPANQILTPEVLNMVPVNETGGASTTVTEAIQYQKDLNFVENQDGSDAILADMTSQDNKVLTNDLSKIDQLLTDLLQIKVPHGLVEYHKVKLIFYSDMRRLAQAYIGGNNAPDPKEVGMEILSLNEYFDAVKPQLLTNYGVQF